MSRIEELRVKIKKHNDAYYVSHRPTITDSEYDKLVQELRKLEREAGVESTLTVGSDLTTGFKKVKHRVPMLSLDNVFSAEETRDFFSGNDVHGGDLVVEPKIDGLSLSVIYTNGTLVQAVTRGNGEQGDDVTENALMITDLPKTLAEKISIEVRGECYMKRSTFAKLNSELAEDEQFSNPRNAASGSLKQKDPYEVAKRGLSFLAYRVIGASLRTQEDVLKFLGKQGFVANSYDLISSPDKFDDLIKLWNEKRKTVDLDLDGLVVKLNNLSAQDELGDGSRAVKWGVAYKFPPERKVTKLIGIELTVGKSGQIAPNAVMEPVELDGAVVRHASLCNADEIARLGINVGDMIYVERAASVIPKICGLAEKKVNGVYKFEEKCPSCSVKIVREGVHYFCPNDQCPEQVIQYLIHATGKACLDIDGCGDQTVRDLYKIGVRKLSEIFTVVPSNLKTAARARFLAGREAAKKQPLWRKIAALGIDGIGRTLSKDLTAKYSSILAITEASEAELRTILGPVCARNFITYCIVRADEIEKLDAVGFKLEEDAKKAGPLTGKVFCLTGTLMSGSRDQVSQKIEEAGGTVKSSVGKKVTYLVAGVGGGNTKAEAARKCGTKVISEDELFAMLGEKVAVNNIMQEEREY